MKINKHENAKEINKAILYRINRKDYKDALYWTGWLIQTLMDLIEDERPTEKEK